jgi:tetratricopeptide (TPR) repeat protein
MGEAENQLERGIALQEAGDWAGALACYLVHVARSPGDVQGLYRAGLAQAHERNLDSAAELLSRCLALQPTFAAAPRALGAVLLSAGRNREATLALERACALMPASFAVHFELGAAYLALGQTGQAAASYRKAAKLNPDDANTHNGLGNALKMEGKLQDAVRAYERAVKASPVHAEAWFNLGTTRQIQEKYPKAIDAYARSLALYPGNPSAENNLGVVLKAQGRIGEAIAAFRRAMSLKPDYALAMANLGAVLQNENQLEEAVSMLRSALALNPNDAQALGNLGNAYLALNRPDEAIAAYEKALATDPAFAGNTYNMALARLVSGDFENGWAGYDSRLETAAHRRKYPFNRPRWNGVEPIAGRTLLVYAEQGLGDTLQFVRYVPMLEARGARVIVRVQAGLKVFLADQAFTAAVIGTGDPLPDHDLQCSLLSLPRHFGTRLDSIPAVVPYLAANESKVAQWRGVFARADGLKVGLVWAGNPKHQFDHNRSVPLALFSAVTDGVAAHFFALQKEIPKEDVPALAATPRITDLSKYITNFAETAAIVAALDLVITVDTSVAHLAGALGKKAWVLISHAPDWRWLLDRSDSPWYPSVRLFRQPVLGDWTPVIQEIRTELAEIAR